MRDQRKAKGQPATEADELRRRVAELERALRQAEEDRGRTLAHSSDLEKLEREARLFAESIVQTVREPLLVLDEKLRVKTANRAFYDTFQVAREEMEGRLLYELGGRQWNIPALRTLLEEILPKSS